MLVLCAFTVRAQVYQVGPGASQAPSGSTKDQAQSLGWGSNIENARLGRAAETALERRDYARAVDYAQRATQAAPNDPQLWFLLGYAARLDGKYLQSVDAYMRGLRLKPSDLDALSGLAQVYSLMGRTDEAMRLLKQAVAARPDRIGDLLG